MKPRNYNRFNFQKPVGGRLQITRYKEKEIVSDKFTRVGIINISQGGICFSSSLNFPCSADYLVKVTFRQETVVGCIVWKQKNRGSYIYGLEIFSANVGFIAINHDLKAGHPLLYSQVNV